MFIASRLHSQALGNPMLSDCRLLPDYFRDEEPA